MSRNYKPIPPHVTSCLTLSDDHPSGLAWAKKDRYRKPGDPVTRKTGNGRFYSVSINSNVYLAHRVVYYLRTGEDPGASDVVHGPDNLELDNRKPLSLSTQFSSKRRKRYATYEDIRNQLPYIDEDLLKEFIGQLVLLGGTAANTKLQSTLEWDETPYENARAILLKRFVITTKRAPGGAVSLATPVSYLGSSYLQYIAEPFFHDHS